MRVARRVALLAAWALSCAAVSPAQAQVYKWTDAEGKVRYGDKPPEGARASAVEDRTSSHGKVASEAKAGKEADKRHKKRMAEVDRDLARRKAAPGKEEAAQASRKQAYEQCKASRRTDCEDLLKGKSGPPASTPRVVVGARQPQPVQPTPPAQPAQPRAPASMPGR